MFLKRSRWWLRKEQLSPRRSITSCPSQCYSPSSLCSISVALHRPCMSLIAGQLSHFTHCLSPNFLIPYLLCLFCATTEASFSTTNLRQLTFMRLDIPVQPLFICTVSNGIKATSPFPHMQWVTEDQFPRRFHSRSDCCPQMIVNVSHDKLFLRWHLFWFHVITNLYRFEMQRLQKRKKKV